MENFIFSVDFSLALLYNVIKGREMISIGRKDTLTKEYMSRNDIFADVFNYILYAGNPVIAPEHLMDKNTTELILPMGKNGDIVPVQRYRDILKGLVIKESPTMIYALLGIENQSEIHYAMPVKNLLYDTINYASQITQKSAEYRKARKEREKDKKDFKETKAEFLSGFHKGDKLKPVITVTVYFGTDEWDAPRTLQEMFDIQDSSIEDFLPDYHIPLILPKEIQNFEQFQSEFGHLMHIIGVSEDRLKMNNLLYGFLDSNISLSRYAIEILNEFIGFSIKTNEQEEKVDMGKVCKALLDERQLGIQEGRRSGLAEGRESGLAEGRRSGLAEGREAERKSIALHLHKEGYSDEFIAGVLQLPVSNVKKILL